ncbi:WecB/TagA/CpsF family glycosyltransferase [Planctomycetota bacterium]
MKSEVLQAGKCGILKVKFDLIAYNVVMETIERWRRNCERHYVTITNPHSVMMCSRDTEMRKATEMASMTLPDGVGIVLAAFLLGYPHNGRTTGPELMLKLCDWGREKDYRHYFHGDRKGVVDQLDRRLSQMYTALEMVDKYCTPFRALT